MYQHLYEIDITQRYLVGEQFDYDQSSGIDVTGYGFLLFRANLVFTNRHLQK